ncbi:flagellar assembly protein FliH [Morganella morganii]|nr:flagellar assembly protein FliH [Morganella morganii]
MSTSDNAPQNSWQPWVPADLLAGSKDDIPVLPADTQSNNAASDEASRAEHARLRQAAEKKGFEQGSSQGYEAGRKEGFDTGLEEGRQKGLEQGKEEMAAQQKEMTDRLGELMHNLQSALDNLDYVIPSRLMQLALSATRSVLGTQAIGDISTTLLQERIKDILRDESLLKNEACLWVSEQDSELIKEQFSKTLAARGWSLNTDSHMLPGGCRITTDEMEIDESLEMRWKMLCELAREDNYK